MARSRSPEKRDAILLAAVHEIARGGLGAPTARIAARAAVAEGTLFTYFPTKEQLFNELYLSLKSEVYTRVHADFPHGASLKRRARHVWGSFLDWAIASPDKRTTSLLLTHSVLLTPETRATSAAQRGEVETTFAEISARAALRNLPAGFVAATMAALQETTMDFVAKQPRRRAQLVDETFEIFWRAFR